jgi:hypothetical protein
MPKPTETLLELPDDVLKTLANMRSVLLDSTPKGGKFTETGRAANVLGDKASAVVIFNPQERRAIFNNSFEEEMTPAQIALIAQVEAATAEIKQLGGFDKLSDRALRQTILKHTPHLLS